MVVVKNFNSNENIFKSLVYKLYFYLFLTQTIKVVDSEYTNVRMKSKKETKPI